MTHGEVRSKKHAAMLQELFHLEQIKIFRKQLPFYMQLLASWQNELNVNLNHHVFFLEPNSQEWSVNGEQKIHLLTDLISMLTDEEIVLNAGFFQSIRRKEVQLLSLATSEDGLIMAETPVLFFPIHGSTYEELLQDYIDEVGLVYFQEAYSRVYKLLYYKLIRDLRGALRKVVRSLLKNCVDEDADSDVYRNQDSKLIFKNIYISSLWISVKLLNISGNIWSLMNYQLQPTMPWKKLAG